MSDSNINLVVLGSGGVGKSAYSIMYIQKEFIDYYDPTIMDSYRKQECIDDIVCFIDIVDTAGQAEFAAMRDPYISGGEGFLLMYSVADRNSFDELTQFRDQVLRVKDIDCFPCVIIGNKSDLPRQVSHEEGELLAQTFFSGCHTVSKSSVPFYEASAKKDLNVKEGFQALVRQVRWFQNPSYFNVLSSNNTYNNNNNNSAPNTAAQSILSNCQSVLENSNTLISEGSSTVYAPAGGDLPYTDASKNSAQHTHTTYTSTVNGANNNNKNVSSSNGGGGGYPTRSAKNKDQRKKKDNKCLIL